MVGLEAAEQVEPGARRVQIDVRDQQIEGVVPDLHQRGLGVLHRHELPVRRLEQLLQEYAGVRVVVDHEDSRHG